MKRIVVFGASGDTGRYFVHYFLEHQLEGNFEIIAAGTRETDFFEKLAVPYYRVDITRKEDFSKLPKDIYAVVDLAGMMPARMKGYEPHKYVDVNITGTLNILEYCRENRVDRILYATSFGDIKDHAEYNPVLRVDLPRKFSFTSDHTVYVMTKNFAVDLIENFHQTCGLKEFIFRLPTIYGYFPVDHYHVDGVSRKIGYRILIDKAIAGDPIEIWGDPARPKDMVYVKDFCQMLYKACFVDRETGHYNVGTGVGTTLLDQIKGIIDVFGREGRKSKIIMRPDLPNAPQYIMDITAAKEELGYEPAYDYISMLKDFKREMEKDARWKRTHDFR